MNRTQLPVLAGTLHAVGLNWLLYAGKMMKKKSRRINRCGSKNAFPIRRLV